jgi:REP element-mobilizing transposase RayT
MARGVDRRDIYMDAQDRLSFLSALNHVKAQTNSAVVAYCLMGNHFHLAYKVNETPLWVAMQRILTNYVNTFNRRHERTGHLFDGRHKANLCLDDRYLTGLIRYIHMNPVRAGFVDHPGKWEWSSYHEYRDKGLDPMLSTKEDIPDFDPWPQPESIPSLIRPESISKMPLEALTESIAREFSVASSEMRSQSKRGPIMAAKRLLIQRALQSGHRIVATANWLNISPSAVSSLLARKSNES